MDDIKTERILIDGNTLIIKNYYNDEFDEQTHNVKDIWSNNNRQCKNLFEFMYNNPNQPNSNIIYKNGKYIHCGYLDGSGANHVKNLGSMKEIWKEFEREHLKFIDFNNIEINYIEDLFWEFYITRYESNFNNSVKILKNYIRKKRLLMSDDERRKEQEYYPYLTDEKWISGCYDYLKYLIKSKTVNGFLVEVVFFKSLENIIGGYFLESTADDERNGIDGFLVYDGIKYPACIKPITYNKNRCVSPIYKHRYVEYSKKDKNLVFVLKTGSDILEKSKHICFV